MSQDTLYTTVSSIQYGLVARCGVLFSQMLDDFCVCVRVCCVLYEGVLRGGGGVGVHPATHISLHANQSRC